MRRRHRRRRRARQVGVRLRPQRRPQPRPGRRRQRPAHRHARDAIGTNPCAADSDGDGVPDGYEYQSAVDLNDDEFQHPNTVAALPRQAAVPEPALRGRRRRLRRRLADAQRRSTTSGSTPTSVTHTDPRDARRAVLLGRQAVHALAIIPSGPDAGRHEPTLPRAATTSTTQFLAWARRNGYRTVLLDDNAPWWDHAAVRNPYGLFDMNRDADARRSWRPRRLPARRRPLLRPLRGRLPVRRRARRGRRRPHELRRDPRPHDARATGPAATRWRSPGTSPTRGRATSTPTPTATACSTAPTTPDFDDVPNVMELSRNAASGLDDTATAASATSSPSQPPLADGLLASGPPTAGSTRSTPASRTPGRGPARARSSTPALGAPFDDSPNWYSLN